MLVYIRVLSKDFRTLYKARLHNCVSGVLLYNVTLNFPLFYFIENNYVLCEHFVYKKVQ